MAIAAASLDVGLPIWMEQSVNSSSDARAHCVCSAKTASFNGVSLNATAATNVVVIDADLPPSATTASFPSSDLNHVRFFHRLT